MMRKWIGAASVLMLMLPNAAIAQNHEHGSGGHSGGGAPHGGWEHHGGPPAGGHFGGGDSHHGGGDFRAQHIAGQEHRDEHAEAFGDRGHRDDFRSGHGRGGSTDIHPEAYRDGPGARGGFPRPAGGWHRGWYAGQRGGWERIRGGGYAYPRGFGYRRWGVGALLPGILFGSSFYWNDYGRYGVYPPPPGDRWVRYGPDLLLGNIRTGRVDDVIYGAFY